MDKTRLTVGAQEQHKKRHLPLRVVSFLITFFTVAMQETIDNHLRLSDLL